MKHRIFTLVFFILLILGLVTGCSRSEINSQVAESIGTLGMYENNEPVETPKMKAEKEMQAAREAMENEVSLHLTKAEKLAMHYDYEAALEEIDQITEEYQQNDQVLNRKLEYQSKLQSLESYTGTIAHFTLDSLVVDQERAYNDPDMGTYHNNWTLTVEEFRNILQQLYDNDYVLMDVKDLIKVKYDETAAGEKQQKEDNSKGLGIDLGAEVSEPAETEVEKTGKLTKSLIWLMPDVPSGKKPFILSFTECDYTEENAAYGKAGKLVLDANGNVKNEYTTADGTTLVGAYDVITIVDEFCEKHPDFSLRGARGIVAVNGDTGVFGYDPETEGDEIIAIADQLKNTGWSMACGGYRVVSMESKMTNEEFVRDMKNWANKIEPLVGTTDLLVYPNGEDLDYKGYKHKWALEHGYDFFFNIWASKEYLFVYDNYAVQSRRPLNGYTLHYYGEDMTEFFDYTQVLDKNRPAFE